ncbi:MAG: hypothetical protein V4640_06130 [Verrucomicrobiota bacterium]
MKQYTSFHISRQRRTIVALVLVSLAAVAAARSAIVTLTIYPTDNNYAVDSNIDGTFDVLATKYPYFILNSSLANVPYLGIEPGDVRSAFEFNLSMIPAGAHVISSQFFSGSFGGYSNSSENPAGNFFRTIYGYAGNGTVTLSDFSSAALLTTDTDFEADVTLSTRSFVNAGASYHGIIVGMGVMGTGQQLPSLDHVPPGPTPSLTITYNTVPEPSNSTLIAGAILFALTKRTRRCIQRR